MQDHPHAAPAHAARNGSFAPSTNRTTLTLDGLLDLDAEELGALYREASVPRLADLRGDLRGRMLALARYAPLVPVARALGRWDRFPWRGKSFRGEGTRGDGINRIFTDRIRRYPFETTVGKSLAGEFDAVILDYDLPVNPFFIRPIRDELRELSPGLFLGQAYLHARGAHHLVLYFGLERRP